MYSVFKYCMSIYYNNYELTKNSVWSFFSGCRKIWFNYYSLDQNYQISEESIGSEPCQRKTSRNIWNSKLLKSSYIDYVDSVILKQFNENGLKQWKGIGFPYRKGQIWFCNKFYCHKIHAPGTMPGTILWIITK